METSPYYILKMKEELSRRQKRSPAYSLRAYGRDLGIHPSTLSLVLKNTRPLPLKNAPAIVEELSLGPKEQTLFMDSLLKIKARLDEIELKADDNRFIIDESYFNVIAEWEHYVVMCLFEVSGFTPSISEIASRLSITEMRADVVIQNLLNCGILRHGKNGLEMSHEKVRTTEDVTSVALQRSHEETLEIGKEKLKSVPVDKRDYSSMTIAIDTDKVGEAKAIIREFRQKMDALMKTGDKKEVYQLAIQFYPMTENGDLQ